MTVCMKLYCTGYTCTCVTDFKDNDSDYYCSKSDEFELQNMTIFRLQYLEQHWVQ